MSGNRLQSLLKYRFQKKDGDKMAKSTEGSQVSSPSVTPGLTSIPDTPESKKPAVETPSPVFKRKIAFGKRGVVVIESESEDDRSSPTKLSSQNSAPQLWLTARPQQNGTSQDSSSIYSPTASSSQASTITTDEEREFQANFDSLKAIFPDKPPQFLREALKNTKTFAQAEDYVIRNNYDGLRIIAAKSSLLPKLSSQSTQSTPPTEYQRIKRPRLESTDSESTPVKKRVKQLNFSDSSSQNTQEYTYENGMSQNGNGVTENCDPETEEKLSFLAGAFPDYSREILLTALKSNNCDVELATVSLSTGPPQILSSQTTPTSIKSIRSNRALAKNSSKSAGMSREEEDDMLDDDSEEDYDSEDSEEDEGPTDPLLNFFNDATVEEMVAMNGCSKKKADAIFLMRPFANWQDLVSKFETGKEISLQLITSCKEIIQIRNMVTKLMKKCEKLAAEMESIVSTLSSRTELDDSHDDNLKHISKQPDLLNQELQLKPYQLIGLNWLALMHDQCLNGILGDEMGLGKTIQSIAFLAHLLEQGEAGPHLIVAPSSTLDNWLRELEKWCPALKVVMYYGSQEERRDIRYQIFDGGMQDFHIVLTTYNMAAGSTEDRMMVKKKKVPTATLR